MRKNLDLREAWSYNWQEYWTSQKICCSCCRRTNNTRDKLFLKGRHKLHSEIDLLQIIKQLRVASFTCNQYLKPHQLKLIRWFDQYKVVVKPEDDANAENEARMA